MTFVSKLKGYEAIRENAKYKKITVDLGTQLLELEVRVPLRAENEALTRRVSIPSDEAVDAQYKVLTGGLNFDDPDFTKVIEATKTFKVVDGEIFYQDTNCKILAWQIACYQMQVEEYFKLLKSATGEPVSETYEEISSEFTDEQIKNFVAAIADAIHPKVEDIKKN